TLDYSYKHEEYITLGYVVTYHYEDNKWVESDRSAIPIYEVLPDGKRVRIQRIIDDNGNVVNVSKEIYKYGENEYSYREQYRWDTESNSWIGEYKSEYGRIEIPEFKVIQPAEPTYFYDEYFIPANMIEESSAQPNHLYFYYNWVWSTENNDWVIDYGSGLKFIIDGNTLTTVYTDYYSGGDYYVSTTKQTVDGNRRLISYSDESKHSYDDNAVTEYKRYVYDADGRLIEKEEDDINRNRTYKYTYGEITFISEVENVTTDASCYNLNGRVLKITGEASAEVYNVQGIKVAVVAPMNSVELPKAGVYIVKMNNNTSKIVVK
ncbi:MAG: hypothetical protein K2J74_00065, partial [Muribaculaceae bacterium]|nr:hypothetical protein [Muribaculaceae bacterium]